jgi:methylthioribose-1-phosphate isomerase
VILDQRGIPERLDEVAAKRGSDVAYYLRLGVVRGGPLMAQVAAYGLALTAAERVDQPAAQRNVELRRTQRALVQARPSSRLPGWAMERMGSVLDRLGDDVAGTAVAAALREEADALATGLQAAHAAISATLAQTLPRPPDRPLNVLLHGDQGALHGGLVGTGLAALRDIRDEGGAIRVFVTEGRPCMDGARLASWELRQAGIEHKVIPDSAVAWLLAREPIDAVLVAAEWIAANGDVGALIGSRAIAHQVAMADPLNGGQRTRFIVSGDSAVVDPGTADGADIPVELRPARELSAYLADVPIRATDALVPAGDVIPAALIDTLVTEHGATAAVTPTAVAALGGVDASAD